ncbi:MAG TPA: 3-hydroxyacyl-ACP dehydratase FabZ [Thermohalobaculum sp.]|nr:3-hydroxyacyl-ACP dehydratase FabZ [Thermohalobaculum sp.]
MTTDVTEPETGSVDLAQIKRMIPHRYPFLMIDKVLNIRKGVSAIGIKNVTSNEPFFPGHFPGEPVLPGVLIVEAMAQTAGVVVVDSLGMIDQDLMVYFMTIDNCRFRNKVVPGDVLELHVQVIRSRSRVFRFGGKAMVAGKLVAEADYSAMIVNANDQRGSGSGA